MAKTEMKFELRENPTMRVEIGGVGCDVELGNPTFVLAAAEWQRKLEAAAADGAGAAELAALASDGLAMVADAVGDEAAERLVGGRNRLNFYRLVDVVRALTAVLSSERSLEAMRGAAADVATLDE